MTTSPAMKKEEFIARARLRHQLRLFERYTEDVCAECGITMPQYLLLLQVAGRSGRNWALIGELAECLALRHNTAVELASRCETAGLVRRERDPQDQRKVRVLLTAAGERITGRIADAHREELERLGAHVNEALHHARRAHAGDDLQGPQ